MSALRRSTASAVAILTLAAPSLRADPTPAAPAAAAAQAAPATPATSPNSDTITLNPFEVSTTKNAGYGANDSNSITQFRSDLYKAPITAQIYNQEFMQDVNLTSPEQVVLAYGGGGVQTNDAGAAGAFNTRPGDNTGSTNLSIRGDKVAIHRDGFLSATASTKGLIGTTDSYSIETAELVVGASSLLYGDSGGGGVLNLVSKQARFGQSAFGSINYIDDQYGSKRATLDYGVGTDHIAARLALVDVDSAYERQNLGGPAFGRYLQFAFKLPGNTIVRLSNMRNLSDTDNGFSVSNVNNFLSTTDPRRNLSLRYLVSTNQTAGLGSIYNPGLTLNDVDSFGGWWKSDREEDTYSNVTVETNWTPWLTSSLGFSYDDSTSDGPSGLQTPTPAAGLANSGANPLPETAMFLSTPGDSLTNTHRMGIRAALLATGTFFNGKAHSQTLLAGEGTRQETSSGISYVYALSDAQGNLIPSATPTIDNGMTVLTTNPGLWWGIQDGLVREPLFRPGTPMITLPDPNNPGQYLHYVHVSRRTGVPSLVSPTNPNGVNGTAGSYSRQDVQTHSYYTANQTEWFGGKIETLAGLRWSDQYSANIGTSSTAVSKLRNYSTTYTVGISGEIFPWLRAFSDLSTSSNPQLNTQNPYGIPNLSSEGRSPQPDYGVKFRNESGSVSGSFTYFPYYTLYNDAVGIDTGYVTQINPTGINGQYEPLGLAGNSQINVDRRSTGFNASMSVHIKGGWTAMFSGTTTRGTYLNTVQFNQVYNDQFRLSGGVAVYADGVTPVMVDPNGKGATTGLVPLTLAMINTVNGTWWANPNVDSGSISSSILKTALSQADPANPLIGASATGVTGLPISAIQYNFTDPNGHNGVITIVKKGDQQIGIPRYTFSAVNKYDFTQGWTKGFTVGLTTRIQWGYANNYGEVSVIPGNTVNADAQRVLYTRPTVAVFGSFLKYKVKLRRVTWTTQLNVDNLLNHYEVLNPPNTAVSPAFNNYLITTEPRLYTARTGFEF